MQKVFNNGNERDARSIMIKIEKGLIEFFFYDQYRRQQEWVEEETERRFENGEDELDEDEKANNNFYWITADGWNSDKNGNIPGGHNWHTHMKEKNWYSKEMEKFIDDNVPF